MWANVLMKYLLAASPPDSNPRLETNFSQHQNPTFLTLSLVFSKSSSDSETRMVPLSGKTRSQ
jgi:hypothetical protein